MKKHTMNATLSRFGDVRKDVHTIIDADEVKSFSGTIPSRKIAAIIDADTEQARKNVHKTIRPEPPQIARVIIA